MADDDYGSRPRPRRKTFLIVALAVAGLAGVLAVLYLTGARGASTQSLGPKNYSTHVECQVNSTGSQGTVTISGTITGNATRYAVTVEVLDAASRQRIGLQTFDVRGTKAFAGTTPAQAPIGPAGIECKIVKVA
ncbi:hypothetical protein [Actinomadura montaniterrae]|uniref:DUF4307 domain-containing protein n=1 Tax=Actinomadura montaniterrae TaxID=1803903 RepID=A0A6L3W4Y1_9ACTN|nr:hypothetical protein [Actinomadura montaniterrae]KAB2389989.1 hypothetical protein F9B16_01730 [Actinomadura montaniterrae]